MIDRIVGTKMNIAVRKAIFLTLVIGAATSLMAQDTIRVVSHNKVKVFTDPSKGTNFFPELVNFPAEEVSFRKVSLSLTMACPDSLHCGEWDYSDHIWLRKKGTKTKYEIARMITPYGWRYDSEWSFTWHIDITDFSMLMHGPTEIIYEHTGYENPEDRGWLVTLQFDFIKGIPAMVPIKIDTLWNGNFPYADTTKSIENFLTSIKLSPPKGSSLARLRVVQTGHGMDEWENCAEFCPKNRYIYYDGELVDCKRIWRNCGENPLYPQAGTWLFDRSGWCPGSIVYPDVYDFSVNDSKQHELDINMEPYQNHNNLSATYSFSSYIIYYKSPVNNYDVSIEEIIAPSILDEYSRKNPICCNPIILIRNNGARELKSISFSYGLKGGRMLMKNWKGSLKPGVVAEIRLPGKLEYSSGSGIFYVRAEKPNGKVDAYPADNYNESIALLPQLVSSNFKLIFRTNHLSGENWYKLNNVNKTVDQSRLGTFSKDSTYIYSYNIGRGCMKLIIADTAGDGLDFWFNPEGGYGFVRMVDENGRLIKSFNSDFGSSINYNFLVTDVPDFEFKYETEVPVLNLFPLRNQGKFTLDIFLNEPDNISIEVINAEGNQVYEQDFTLFKDGLLSIDIGEQAEGLYTLKLNASGTSKTKKFRIKKEQ